MCKKEYKEIQEILSFLRLILELSANINDLNEILFNMVFSDHRLGESHEFSRPNGIDSPYEVSHPN